MLPPAEVNERLSELALKALELIGLVALLLLWVARRKAG